MAQENEIGHLALMEEMKNIPNILDSGAKRVNKRKQKHPYRLEDLKRFSEGFELSTPMPEDLKWILNLEQSDSKEHDGNRRTETHGEYDMGRLTGDILSKPGMAPTRKKWKKKQSSKPPIMLPEKHVPQEADCQPDTAIGFHQHADFPAADPSRADVNPNGPFESKPEVSNQFYRGNGILPGNGFENIFNTGWSPNPIFDGHPYYWPVTTHTGAPTTDDATAMFMQASAEAFEYYRMEDEENQRRLAQNRELRENPPSRPYRKEAVEEAVKLHLPLLSPTTSQGTETKLTVNKLHNKESPSERRHFKTEDFPPLPQLKDPRPKQPAINPILSIPFKPSKKKKKHDISTSNKPSGGHSTKPSLVTSASKQTSNTSLTSMSDSIKPNQKEAQTAEAHVTAMETIVEATGDGEKDVESEKGTVLSYQDSVTENRTIYPPAQEAHVITRFSKAMAECISSGADYSLANEASKWHVNTRLKFLLEEFLNALQLDVSDPTQVRGRKMVHKLRRDIARRFQHRLLSRQPFEDTGDRVKLAGDRSQLTVDEKFLKWSTESNPSGQFEIAEGLVDCSDPMTLVDTAARPSSDPEDHCGFSASSISTDTASVSQDDEMLPNPWGNLADPEAVMAHFSRQQDFDRLVTAAGRLMEQYHSDKMNLVRHKTLLSLRAIRESHDNTNTEIAAIFHVKWDIKGFLTSNYSHGLQQRIGRILAVIGDIETARMCTVDEYMTTTWPFSKGELIRTLERNIQKKRYKKKGGNTNHIGVSSNMQAFTVTGSEEFIVMIGQQLAWLATVCHEKEDSPMYAYVGFERGGGQEIQANGNDKQHVGDSSSCSQFRIWVDLERPPHGSRHSCWNKLVGPAVLIAGFPFPSRHDNQKGLEISVPTMSLLARIPNAVTFRGKYIFKGRYHALVPTASHYTDSIQWHFLETYPKQLTWYDIDELLSQDTPEFQDEEVFWKSRAFLGWCPHVHNYFGAAEYNYDMVRPSDAKHTGSWLQVEKMTVGFSQWAQLTAEISVGKKEGYVVPFLDDSYLNLLDDAKQKTVIFYDTACSRAFQTNGEDLILHVIMHRKSRGLYKPSDDKQHKTNSGQIKHAKLDRERASTRQTMLDNAEEVLSVHPRKCGPGMGQSLFKEEVDRLYTRLDGLWASNYVSNGKAMPLKRSNDLVGWEYLELVQNNPMRPESVETRRSCGKWVDYARDLQAITLFGSMFGDLLLPAGPTSVCPLFTFLPIDKSYLAVRVDTLHFLLDTNSPTGRNWLTRSGFTLEEQTQTTNSEACKHPQEDGSCTTDTVLRLVKGGNRSPQDQQMPIFLSHHNGAVILGEPRTGPFQKFRGMFSSPSSSSSSSSISHPPCQPNTTTLQSPRWSNKANLATTFHPPIQETTTTTPPPPPSSLPIITPSTKHIPNRNPNPRPETTPQVCPNQTSDSSSSSSSFFSLASTTFSSSNSNSTSASTTTTTTPSSITDLSRTSSTATPSSLSGAAASFSPNNTTTTTGHGKLEPDRRHRRRRRLLANTR